MDFRKNILDLKEGESFIVPESDYGKAEIKLENDVYLLYEIPMYGGKPVFHKSYPKSEIDTMISVFQSWT